MPRTLVDSPAASPRRYLVFPVDNGDAAFEIDATPGLPLSILFRRRGCGYCAKPDVTVAIDVSVEDLLCLGLIGVEATP